MSTFRQKILEVVNDQTHGSSFLLKQLIRAFREFQPDKNERYWSFEKLKKLDPAMVIIHHFLRSLEPQIDDGFQAHLQAYENQWQNVEERVAERLIPLLPGLHLNILSHSHSGMVIKVLEIIFKKNYRPHIWQTESLPGTEGMEQASRLRQSGMQVTIIKDQQVAEVIGRINACLLGVDQFDEVSFINKTGSKKIVDECGKSGCPVFVLGDSRKYVNKMEVGSGTMFEVVNFTESIRLVTEQVQ